MTTGDDNRQTLPSGGDALDVVMEQAQALMALKRWDRALLVLQEGLALRPNDAPLHVMTGLCHYHLSQYGPARRSAEEAIAQEPSFDQAYWLLASVALQQDRYREGLQAIETALELDSEYAPYLATRGALLLNMQRPREALKAAEAALAIDPYDETAVNVRTLALAEMGRHPEAEEQAQEALARDPNSAIAWYMRGLQLSRQGRLDEAKEALLASLRLDPENAEAQDLLLKVLGTKHPVFSLFWRWSFFLSRFPNGVRWGIILGLWALMQVMRGIGRANPAIMPLITPVFIAYALFCVYTWVAFPLFRLAIKWRWIR
ncbi:MAG TPA: tetratricopeptide repeat protein [Armatimonadota bacterium]|nr:tetratricopeptide repeat protein [Armatimonadota bacterium]HOS43254.1 tetratricopeptide repeat protein [Armatimonadota bacterium]